VSLVVVDADVLGRQRTGDETYVANLLRTLPGPASEAGLRLAAVTRRPDLVPEAIEAVALPARSQEVRMAWGLPRALRRLGAALVHTQYAIPLRPPCPAVVTVHDLSFERGLQSRRDRIIFKRVVPHAVRAAARVLTVSERTKNDLVELYDVEPEHVVVTPNGVDPAFSPKARTPVREADRGMGSGETGRFPQLRSFRQTLVSFASMMGVSTWMPHSSLSEPAHRPARSSSSGEVGRVHGMQPIDR
jgi:glycosyltransferase involved in cell wall biosynthesis